VFVQFSLEVTDEFERSSSFHGVALTGPSEADRQRFASFKAKFFQALVDNLSARFTGTESLFQNVRVLQKANWPEAEEKRILYGDREDIDR